MYNLIITFKTPGLLSRLGGRDDAWIIETKCSIEEAEEFKQILLSERDDILVEFEEVSEEYEFDFTINYNTITK